MFRIENLPADAIAPDMLANFHHHQVIRQSYVKADGGWKIENICLVREWSAEKRMWITQYLREQIGRGGAVMAAYSGQTLVGFCSVDGYLQGETAKYANMTMLFVDDGFKRQGVGKALFKAICKCAATKGAEKLFVSAVPSVDTVAFYFAQGCVDASEIIPDYVDTEEDRYLEYGLGSGTL